MARIRVNHDARGRYNAVSFGKTVLARQLSGIKYYNCDLPYWFCAAAAAGLLAGALAARTRPERTVRA